MSRFDSGPLGTTTWNFARSRPGGTAVRILGFAWFSCFVAMQLAFATPGDVLAVDIEQADLRTAPDPTAPVLLRATRGLRLIEFERRDGWVRVRVVGRLGKDAWIHEAGATRTRIARPLAGAPPSPPYVMDGALSCRG